MIAAGEETEYAKILQQRWELGARQPSAPITRRSLLLLMLLPPGVMLLSHYHESVFVYILLGLAASLMVWLQNGVWFTARLTARANSTCGQVKVRANNPVVMPVKK